MGAVKKTVMYNPWESKPAVVPTYNDGMVMGWSAYNKYVSRHYPEVDKDTFNRMSSSPEDCMVVFETEIAPNYRFINDYGSFYLAVQTKDVAYIGYDDHEGVLYTDKADGLLKRISLKPQYEISSACEIIYEKLLYNFDRNNVAIFRKVVDGRLAKIRSNWDTANITKSLKDYRDAKHILSGMLRLTVVPESDEELLFALKRLNTDSGAKITFRDIPELRIFREEVILESFEGLI